MSPSTKRKIVKAWYVDLGLRIKPEFSGKGYNYRARIFPTRKLARAAFSNPVDVIPVEIHYQLKGKKK